MVQADALFGMWAAAQAQGSAGTSAAFHAALQLLSSQQPTQNALASKPASPLGSPRLMKSIDQAFLGLGLGDYRATSVNRHA